MAKGKAGAPKGNKNAVGHGRPPKISQEKAIEIGKDLVKWLKSPEFKDVVHICEYYLDVKDLGPSDWDRLSRRDCFQPYYEKARIAMAKQILKNKNLSQSYGNRYLSMYDKKLHAHEEANRDREAERKQKEERIPPNTNELTLAIDLMKQLDEANKIIKELKAKKE